MFYIHVVSSSDQITSSYIISEVQVHTRKGVKTYSSYNEKIAQSYIYITTYSEVQLH